MKVAEYLIKRLEEIGIENIFGVQNEFNQAILDVIENNKNLNFVGCTNILNAGYAADGYAREKGYGAVVSSYGSDEMNVLNAILGCYEEQIPVIHIVGTPLLENISYKFQEMYKNITETTAFLNRDNAKVEIDRVLKIFLKEKKPVYIAIPADVVEKEMSIKKVDYSWNTDAEALNVVVNLIAEKIRKSKKPMVISDILVKRFNAAKEYQNFIEKTGLLASNLLGGVNLINSELKNNLGTYFSKYYNPKVLKNLEDADCLIEIGCVYSGIYPYKLEIPNKFNSKIIIQGTYVVLDGIKYDDIKMSDLLASLAEKIEYKEIEISEISVDESAKTIEADNNLSLENLFYRLQMFLKQDYVLLVDSSLLRFGIVPMSFSNRSEILFQVSCSSTGWATPASFGVALANQDKKVVLLTDKISHQASVIELGNMLKQGQSLIVITVNDKVTTNREASININFSKLSRSFEDDIWSTRVENLEDFDKALKVTQILKKLSYIEVCMESSETLKIFEEVSKDYNCELKKKISKINNNLEDIKLSEDNMGYETKVHESLKD